MTDPTRTSPVTLDPAVAPEDQARAEFYALLGRLFAAAPDPALLAALGASDLWGTGDGNPLSAAWNALVLATRGMDAEAAEQEYTDVFVGVGKSEINLHASHWIAGFMMEKPLADLRTQLAGLGLARRDGVNVTEDHLSALCETMRILIAGDGRRARQPLAVQRAFFDRWIAPWVPDCCAAICECPIANYYVRVAQFASLFVAVERDSFAME